MSIAELDPEFDEDESEAAWLDPEFDAAPDEPESDEEENPGLSDLPVELDELDE